MNQTFREYVENELSRDDDKELFRDLLGAYNEGGPKEVKNAIQSIIEEVLGA